MIGMTTAVNEEVTVMDVQHGILVDYPLTNQSRVAAN